MSMDPEIIRVAKRRTYKEVKRVWCILSSIGIPYRSDFKTRQEARDYRKVKCGGRTDFPIVKGTVTTISRWRKP